MYAPDDQRRFEQTLKRAQILLYHDNPISMRLFGQRLWPRIDQDVKYMGEVGDDGDVRDIGRPFLQVRTELPCNDSGEQEVQSGRKYYLSPHMTDDEIVKTAFEAYKAFVNHEMLEGFKLGGTRLVDPHTDFRYLLEANQSGTKRHR